jgi:hypothetical protein
MGDWRVDQSKTVRRMVWGRTRGEGDATWKDFSARFKNLPPLAALRVEKIGSEIHAWRSLKEAETGKIYWVSCLRFVDDGLGYWTVLYRSDERRWRTTTFKEMPLGRAVEAASDFYKENVAPHFG